MFTHKQKWFDRSILGLPIRFLYPSPSKIFFLRRLRAALEDLRGIELALDVASAHFKYRQLFKSTVYVGLDRDPGLIARGQASLEDADRAYGIATEFFALSRVSEVADLIVSTHTIAHLPRDRWVEAVRILGACVRPGGHLFFNVPTSEADAEIEEYLGSYFGRVEKIRYANRLSMAMEAFFDQRTHYKGIIGVVFLGLAASAALLLSFIEELRYFRKNGRYTLFFARYKRSRDLDDRLERLRGLNESNQPAV